MLTEIRTRIAQQLNIPVDSITADSKLVDDLALIRRASVGAMLSKNAFKALKTRMDYTEYGGAPLLGINGGIIKAHGSSDERAVCSAIGQARKLILGNVTNTISGLISREMEPQAGK